MKKKKSEKGKDKLNIAKLTFFTAVLNLIITLLKIIFQ